MTTRVLLADDQELVRAGFRMILETQADIQVVGEAGDGVEAVAATRRLQPEVVLMDIRMPNLDGLQATKQLMAARSGSRVLILTTFDLDEYVYQALTAGASGFLLKNAPPEQLISAVRVVAAGDALLAPSVTRRVIEQFTRLPPPGGTDALVGLTAREREVLKLVARGLSNAEIAAELVVSDATVKSHVAHLLAKLQLRDRVQAVVRDSAQQPVFEHCANRHRAGVRVSDDHPPPESRGSPPRGRCASRPGGGSADLPR